MQLVSSLELSNGDFIKPTKYFNTKFNIINPQRTPYKFIITTFQAFIKWTKETLEVIILITIGIFIFCVCIKITPKIHQYLFNNNSPQQPNNPTQLRQLFNSYHLQENHEDINPSTITTNTTPLLTVDLPTIPPPSPIIPFPPPITEKYKNLILRDPDSIVNFPLTADSMQSNESIDSLGPPPPPPPLSYMTIISPERDKAPIKRERIPFQIEPNLSNFELELQNKLHRRQASLEHNCLSVSSKPQTILSKSILYLPPSISYTTLSSEIDPVPTKRVRFNNIVKEVRI
jgi:hypothetical protein